MGAEGPHQQGQQDAAGSTTGPHDPIQDAMIGLKMLLLAQSHHPRDRRYGSFAGGKNGAAQQKRHRLKNPFGEQRGEFRNQSCEPDRQPQHDGPLALEWPSFDRACRVCV